MWGIRRQTRFWEHERSISFMNKSCLSFLSTEEVVKYCSCVDSEELAYWEGRHKDNSCHGRGESKTCYDRQCCRCEQPQIPRLCLWHWRLFGLKIKTNWRWIYALELIVSRHAPGRPRTTAWCNLLTPNHKPRAASLNRVQNSAQIQMGSPLYLHPPGDPLLVRGPPRAQIWDADPDVEKFQELESEGHANKQKIDCAFERNRSEVKRKQSF